MVKRGPVSSVLSWGRSGSHKRARRHGAMSLETLEQRQLLATGPQLLGIQPNVDATLQNFDVLESSPRELRFIFSQGQAIDADSLDGIVVTRSGLDDSFEAAEVVSDLGTDGDVLFRFVASVDGVGGNDISLTFKNTEFPGAQLPVATVDGRTVRVELNSNPDHLSTASQVLAALNANPAVAELFTASIIGGSPSAPIVRGPTAPAPVTLTGANQARGLTDMGTGGPVQIEFLARDDGAAGQGISVVFQHADLGPGTLPQVLVVDRTITVRLNTNAMEPTSAFQLVNAINADFFASNLVTAVLRSGDPGTDVATPSEGIEPVDLRGGTDIVIPPAYAGLDPDRANEVIVRFGERLPDDLYSIDILGVGDQILQNTAGEPFDCATNDRLVFQLDRGAQIVSVVPQPVTRGANGRLFQAKNVIDIYFNDDDLNRDSATNRDFYRLIRTADTVSNTDDAVYSPTSVDYDSIADRARLTFGNDPTRLPGGPGTYRLRVGTAESLPMPPVTSAPQARYVVTLTGQAGSIPITFTAAQDFGKALHVRLTARDFGAAVPPSVTVSGDEITIEVNSNAATPSTVQNLIDAVAGSVLGSQKLMVTADTMVLAESIGAAVAASPQTFVVTGIGSSFATATELGTLTPRGVMLNQAIAAQYFPLDLPGANEDPGHRDLQFEQHLGLGTRAADEFQGISTITYNFRDIYGRDPSGNPLQNVITENQKQRAREVFELLGEYLGAQFVEIAEAQIPDVVLSGGATITIVTGDPRALNPLAPTGPNDGVIGGTGAIFDPVTNQRIPTILLDAAESWDDTRGGDWFKTAMRFSLGALGIRDANDLPDALIANQNDTETTAQFPNDQDIVHGQHVFRPESKDIDLYRFGVTTAGRMTAEIVAERSAASSALDSAMVLYREDADGSRVFVASNDDYFSKDSFLALDLVPGTYYVGVSASGNTTYDPNLEDSGFGGTTQGPYSLRMNYRPDVLVGILDATGKLLDGDADGLAGGEYNFWFQSQTDSNTLFVDKATATPGSGTLTNPYSTIAAAISAADPGDIVRIVGNGGADSDLETTEDNRAYEVGFNNLGQPLADGGSLRVPRGVTVMIDEGAIFKMRLSSIVVGSTSPSVDRSQAALQVLGTPNHQVFFTSLNDDTVGVDTNSFVTSPRPGDWAGIEFRNDVDRAEGRIDYEGQGAFLNYVNNAEFRYGGGSVLVDSEERVISPVQMIGARPTISNNFIRFSADAAISANPDSFEITNFHATDSLGVYYQETSFTPDYRRVGPSLHDNRLLDNSVNGLFIRVEASINGVLETMTVSGRWDDGDIVHVVGENLIVAGQPGGGFLAGGAIAAAARTDATLAIDPGVVVKLDGTRIELPMGGQLLAEGTVDAPIIFTALSDERFGAGGTFDTNPRTAAGPSPGVWAGIYAGPTSGLSLDHAWVSYGGGVSSIEGAFAGFNPVEIRQARARIADTRFEFNAEGVGGTISSNISTRNGRGSNGDGVIYVQSAQPVLIKNLFANNEVLSDDNGGSSVPAISINVNALNPFYVTDWGRSTGTANRFVGLPDNQGPVVRGNRFDNNENDVGMLHGMVVRGEELTTESVWDDTDITHILFSDVVVPDYHAFGGVRLESSPGESLVVKLGNPSSNLVFNRTDYPTNNETEKVTTGDFDGDGDLDIAAAAFFNMVEVLLNNGDGTYPAAVSYDALSLTSDIDSADMDGDGDIDLVVSTFDGLSVFLNNGDGTFAAATQVAGGQSNAETLDLADVDGDQDVDVALGFFGNPTVAIFTNNGTGGLNAAGPVTAGTTGANDVQFADLDGDGNQDLIVANAFPEQIISVFLGNGDATFGAAQDFAVPGVAESLTTADFNEDGDADVAVGSANNVYVFLGNGDGTLAGPVPNTIISTASDIVAGDLNGDGHQDLVTSNFLGGTVSVLLGDGLGSFGNSVTVQAAGGFGVDLGDVDGDGDLDIVVATFASEITVIYNARSATGNGGFLATGRPLENSDRIGGRVQVIGQPGAPVVLTSLADDSVGAGFRPDGRSLTDTNTDASATVPTPGDWGGITLDQYSHDRNVEVIMEGESSTSVAPGTNGNPLVAQRLGELAPGEKAGDENRRLGFEIHGYLSAADADVYSFRGTAGTEVWLDVDLTNTWLDSVVELIDANGAILASSDSTYDEANGASLGGQGHPLRKSPFVRGDYLSSNPKDPGMRVTLPGTAGRVNLYHVRVRMSPEGAPATGADSRLGGNYQLGIRLNDVDEVSGSTVRYSDIRYATNGITLEGQPAHSPLLGELAETTADNDDFTTAQNIGNVLTTERGAISIAGNLSNKRDVDWFQFEVNYDAIEPEPHDVASLVFDTDFADQLARPNMSIYLFDSAGNLIFLNQDGTPADDISAPGSGTSGISDLTRGSLGRKDAFLGPISLRNGTYYMAVTSSANIPDVLDDTGAQGQGGLTARVEPINTVTRIAEDRVPAGSTTAAPPLMPSLFADASVVPWHLGDMTMYVSGPDGSLSIVDPFSGAAFNINENFDFVPHGRQVADVAFQDDGSLYAYVINTDAPTDENTGQYIQISIADGTATDLEEDGLETLYVAQEVPMPPDPPPDPTVEQADVGFNVEALTYLGNSGFAVGNRPPLPGMLDPPPIPGPPVGQLYETNILYAFLPDTGAFTSAPDPDRVNPDDLLAGTTAGTLIVERGVIDTSGQGNATITGLTIGNDGMMYAVSDRGGLYQIADPVTPNQGPALATFVGRVGAPQNIRFTGLVAPPATLEENAYQGMLFGIDDIGTIHAFDTRGASQPVFYNGTSSITTGIADANGIAFSSLERNLWHQSTNRAGDDGHGIDAPPDNTRLQVPGGRSYYFGREPLEADFNYAGIGGAHGSLVTLPFDLAGYTEFDQPYFYFNYFLDTEDDAYEPAANDWDAPSYDALRVSIADRTGLWALVGTNDGFQSNTQIDEYDYGTNVVELLDGTGGWRQARINLAPYVGREGLRLRFDFATGGTLQLGNIPGDPMDPANPPMLTTGGDELIAVDGQDIVDGDTFVIYRNGNINFPVTFEFDTGYTLALPEGGRIADGDLVSIRVGNVTEGFEFDFDGNVGAQSVRVPISRLSSPEDVARELSEAIAAALSTVLIPHQYGHRINLQAFGTIEVKTNNAPAVTLEGAPGAQPGNRAIVVHAGLPAFDPFLGDDVAHAIRSSLANRFTNGEEGVIKITADTIRVVGHAVDVFDRGPLGVSHYIDPGSGTPINGLPADILPAVVLPRPSATFAQLPDRYHADNVFEGVYIDDLTIGFAGRGEMVSGATGGNVFVPAPGSDDPNFSDITTGVYQIEIRPSSEFTVAADPVDVLLRTMDIRDRLSDSFSLEVPSGAQLIDGQQFMLGDVTLEFDNLDLTPGVDPGNVQVPYRTARPAAEIASSLVTVINDLASQGRLTVTAAARPGFNRVDLHGDPSVVAIDERLYEESNDSLATAIDAGIRLGTTGYFRGQGIIGDNFALTPSYSPDDLFATRRRLDVDLVRFELLAGQTLYADVDADELTTGLDSMLRIFDADGIELALSDDDSAPGETPSRSGLDPFLSFVVPEDGVYYVGVSAYENRTYDPLVELSGTEASSEGAYQLIARVSAFNVEPVTFQDRGDRSRARDQGQILIHSNMIQDAAEFGINVGPGERDADSEAPHPGPPRNLSELNSARLARGPVIFNNVIVAGQQGAIRFAGTPTGTVPGAVPFGRIVNNTLYGGGGNRGGAFTDTGVLIQDNASPTLLNNVIANFSTPISVDGTSSSTVLGGNIYKDNSQDPYLTPMSMGAFDVDLDDPAQANKALFINPGTRNFYLQSGSRAIDSSIDALQDRPDMTRVNNPLGIVPSPILAPDRDGTGQLRVDDPAVEPPSGIGQNAFKDRGALDRSDFTGPMVEIVNPADNDAAGIDLDPAPTSIRWRSGPLAEITLRLMDVSAFGGTQQGSGVDDNTVGTNDVSVLRDGTFLAPDVDYRFDYDATGNLIVLTPLTGVWSPGAYTVGINRNGIRDLAGNALQANQADSSVRFTITLGQGMDFGDAPDPPFRTLLDRNGARHTIEPGFFLGSGVTGERNGQPSNAATGDLGDDGVTFAGLLRQGTVTMMQVTASGAGFVDAWIDFDGNDVWEASAGEKVLDSAPVTAGSNAFDLLVPADAVLGATFARFRLSRNGNLNSTSGLAPNGEVEDYRLVINDPGLDYGDAPAPYPTLASDTGAFHAIVPGFFLGSTVTAQDDGNPSPSAAGDADDDGITFIEMLTANSASDVRVTASAAGFLDAWIDFNQDGIWDASTERIFTGAELTGDDILTINTPSGALQGSTVARFRFSSAGVTSPTGGAEDGEVEDYEVTISPEILPDTFDFGDAPDPPFQTLLANDGARHTITTGVFLGTGIDAELDGEPSAEADRDADDGVEFSDLLAGEQATITVTASQAGQLDAWLDFNGNGNWSDTGEKLFDDLSLVAGPNVLTITVPEDAFNGTVISRFRFSTAGGLQPFGLALDGEVEDYAVTLVQPEQTWHNFSNPLDVNNVDGIQPLDALLVINELTNRCVSDPITGVLEPLPLPPVDDPPRNPPCDAFRDLMRQSPIFLDVTNDGFASPLDALLVINALPSNSPQAPSSGTVVGDGLAGAGEDVGLAAPLSAKARSGRDRLALAQGDEATTSGSLQSVALRALLADEGEDRERQLRRTAQRFRGSEDPEEIDLLFAAWNL